MDPLFLVEESTALPLHRGRVEIVERKGIGHPDTICDSIAEAVSGELCRAYLDVAGRVLHHNIDKSLLIAGKSEPRIGGGRVLAPMRLIIGDRATFACDGQAIPVAEIAVETARRWVEEQLRFVVPANHLQVESVLRPGSPQLIDVFEREALGANDTSAGVGYAPLTETERIVLATERTINAPAFKEQFPEAGEDVKVMGVRVDRRLELTVAIAFVDRFVESARSYTESKAAIRRHLMTHLGAELCAIDELEIAINTLDREGRGVEGMYLTVLGTSAEGADSGEVGRGNRVNGLICFQRPQSMEAAAGKNPVCHVGKIYNLLGHEIARRVHADIAGLEDVSVYLCSRIGNPIEKPWIAAAQVVLAAGVEFSEVAEDVRALLEREVAHAPAFLQRLLQEPLPVC